MQQGAAQCRTGGRNRRRVAKAGVVERGLGDLHIRPPPNLFFAHRCEVNADGEHVGISGHARVADGFGALQIRLGRTHGRIGDRTGKRVALVIGPILAARAAVQFDAGIPPEAVEPLPEG